MKLGLLFFTFFISSLFLIVIAIERNANFLHSEKIRKLKISQIQTSFTKTYRRTRKTYVPEQSFILASKKIENILLKEPIVFTKNDSSLLGTVALNKIVKIINHVKDDVVLSVLAHTDVNGTEKHNLSLSQKRADSLKEYFRKKTNLPLVVAIGYGEAFTLEKNLIELNLKRIK